MQSERKKRLKMKNVRVFLADGFEEIEALTVVDILRRAGVETTTVSVTKKCVVEGAHGICVEADALFEESDFHETEMLVFPGGMPGTLNLQAHTGLRELLLAYGKMEKYVAAICAAPSILGELGMLDGKRACCYPSFEEKLTGAEVVREPVVLDQNVITSRGMGTAIPFALKLAEVLCGMERAEEVRKSIIYNEE